MKIFTVPAGNVITALILFSLLCFGCGSSTIEDGDTPIVSAFTVYTDSDGLADNYITDIMIDYSRKGVWCSTWNGLSFYSDIDSTWTTFAVEYDLPSLEVTSLAIDYMTGTVWAGTASGPAFYSENLWTSFADMDSLVHRYITTVTSVSDGSLWFGTKGGVSRRDNFFDWKSYITATGLAGDYITSIAVNAIGNVWIGTTNGISVFDEKKWTAYGSSVLPDLYVRVIYKAYDGNMWCGTATGIAVFDGTSWKRYGTFDGLPDQSVNDFTEDRSKIMWVATDGGAAEFDGSKWIKLTLPDQVKNESVLCLAADIISGVLWIGTTNGVVRHTR